MPEVNITHENENRKLSIGEYSDWVCVCSRCHLNTHKHTLRGSGKPCTQ